jgi:NAD(P)-dependent dehydrogenase (short-subunit alcohol dehydrogenase family)
MKRLAGKTALITGASSGIGRAIAKKFHDEGAELLLMDITEQVAEGGEPTHRILDVPFFQGDVSKEVDVEEAVRRAAAPTGRLDIVVNDAVVRAGKPLTETSLEEWNHVMAVNVTGVFLMCRAAVRRMLTQEIRHEARGRIVNISSQHGMVGPPGHVAYAAAKGGVVNLTRQIAVDFAEQGIVCNAIAPGKIVVPREGGQDPELLSYAHARTPWPRLGEPEDVAALGVFLASDECRFMTGANVLIDGGFMAY